MNELPEGAAAILAHEMIRLESEGRTLAREAVADAFYVARCAHVLKIGGAYCVARCAHG